MAYQTEDISDLDGIEFLNRLSSLVKDEENWNGGKIYKFTLVEKSRFGPKFIEIKAVKELSPIEELMTFTERGKTSTSSWEEARGYLQLDGLLSMFKTYRGDRLHNHFAEMRGDFNIFWKICFMLTFELARCDISSQRKMTEAIFLTLEKNREEDKMDLSKMFPNKDNKETFEEEKKNAMYRIYKREKMEHILQIYGAWPRGESADGVLEILSKNSTERENAFKEFMNRKKKCDEVLLDQHSKVLQHFKAILSTEDAEDASRAFEQLDKELKKQNE